MLRGGAWMLAGGFPLGRAVHSWRTFGDGMSGRLILDVSKRCTFCCAWRKKVVNFGPAASRLTGGLAVDELFQHRQ